MPKNSHIITVIVILIVSGFLLSTQDACLDQGGCWDSTANKCRSNEKYSQLLCHQNRFDACSVDKACESGFTCISHSVLKSPMCIKDKDVCTYFCNAKDCMIMESYPAQVSCKN